MHRACHWGYFECLCLLLRHGARTDIQTQKGKTPIEVAKEKSFFGKEGRILCVEQLTQWRALRPLRAFCILKVCVRENLDLSRLPGHLQQEISEIRKSPIETWRLFDRLEYRADSRSVL
eukprot:TRINITY_DN5811_c0_g1_i2.p2 TRINITY_DN5811_c0_g1~~TRINITY_DN5811_c0_g1_i2.p2  ORF type:complete len:119 (+),score=23.92 TRINITY_DN5811_c0_g1_i2:525-881(+)